jgi:hypothetical protein
LLRTGDRQLGAGALVPLRVLSRRDPWDPKSAPSAKQVEVAKNAVEAARYLAEGEAELDALLGSAASIIASFSQKGVGT